MVAREPFRRRGQGTGLETAAGFERRSIMGTYGTGNASRARRWIWVAGWTATGALALALGSGCDQAEMPSGAPSTSDSLRATIGPQGGQLVGQPGTALAGVRLDV